MNGKVRITRIIKTSGIIGNLARGCNCALRWITKTNHEKMELIVISQRMTVTVIIQGMHGNGVVLGKKGCCRGRNQGGGE